MGTIKAVNPTDKWRRFRAAPSVQPCLLDIIMKQEKLKLYTMDMKYVRDLHNSDDRVQSVSPQIHKSNRPFVGVVIVCDKHKYCIPLDHPKDKHYKMKNDIDFTRIFDGEKLIGVLNFNNMIPVEDSLIRLLDVKTATKDTEEVKAYKNLCAKELDWVQKNQEAIVKKANKLYQMIVSDIANQGLKRRCLDFKKLEAVLEKRKNSHMPKKQNRK